MERVNDFLHPQLRQDCIVLGKLRLCYLLLMNDARYPWFVLVPGRPNIVEMFQLSAADRYLLCDESAMFAQTLATVFAADKINVAALGNVVPQLHLHHIARYRNDAAWPKPVWGALPPQPYLAEERERVSAKIRSALSGYPAQWVTVA